MKKISDELIEAITDFIFINRQPEQADCIFVPGGSNSAPAVLAARLYNEGYAPIVIPSGKGPYGVGRFSGDTDRGVFDTECDFYCSILSSEGVPSEAILREDKAEFTKENAILTRRLCDYKGFTVKKALLSVKSYHSRRAYTYYGMYFPEAEIIPVSVDIPGRGREDWYLSDKGIERICGEVSRMANQFVDFLKENKDK
ncbi:MAG: YdcF family protein [Firmicutes bacterium]|nr:YdcF family protein [Bacillota bacterium]